MMQYTLIPATSTLFVVALQEVQLGAAQYNGNTLARYPFGTCFVA
jgi:hypothetical protein